MRITPRKGRLVVVTALAALLGLASPAWAAPSNTTLTATPQSTAVGAPVQLQATVNCPADPTDGLGVTFFDDHTLLGTVPANATGQAGFTTTFTTTGTHTITAAYNGNTECDASSATTGVQVTAAPTPPAATPGLCLLACNGLITFTGVNGDLTNNIGMPALVKALKQPPLQDRGPAA
ncbi:Ig-like domain repeat protein [Streptomyces sp. NPDC096012]|uniref:Ig-like domain repeat protein n=1 Tax=Streptomyces sp. NPDC096012 TaxID=3155684 RepID=UPI00336A567E